MANLEGTAQCAICKATPVSSNRHGQGQPLHRKRTPARIVWGCDARPAGGGEAHGAPAEALPGVHMKGLTDPEKADIPSQERS